MNFEFDQDSPLYQQIANQLAEMIFTGVYQAGDQVPSTTQLSASLNINPATVLKGMNQLVALGLLEKRRGRGMFVTPDAQEQLATKHRDDFYRNYVVAMVAEAKKLGIKEEHLQELIKRGYQDDGQ